MSGAAAIFLLSTCTADPLEWDIKTIASGERNGSIAAISTTKLVLGNSQEIESGEWYAVQRRGTSIPDYPKVSHVELVNGDRIIGKITDCDGTTLHIIPAFAAPAAAIQVPMSGIRVVWITRQSDPAPYWLTQARKRDVFQLRSGDVVLGAIDRFDTATNLLRYQSDGKSQQLDWSSISAIGMNTDLARIRKPKGSYFRVIFRNGSRLSVPSIAFDGTQWTVQTTSKESLQFPAEFVVSVDVEQGKAAHLSDLRPSNYQYQTFDGEEHTWHSNTNVLGGPLRLSVGESESTFDRGVGLHASCSITYKLEDQYRRFEALVGLDAQVGATGNAELDILVDGRSVPLPAGGKLLGNGPVRTLAIDVLNGKELTIIIRSGVGGNVCDRVNLADARLISK